MSVYHCRCIAVSGSASGLHNKQYKLVPPCLFMCTFAVSPFPIAEARQMQSENCATVEEYQHLCTSLIGWKARKARKQKESAGYAAGTFFFYIKA
jgi:hypothetical protein